MQYFHLTRSLTAFCLVCLAAPTHAQQPIDEIVVTADFRERPLSELPASVSVLNDAFIEEVAVQHFEELVNVIPNLNWSGDGHRARYFQIRGVGELESPRCSMSDQSRCCGARRAVVTGPMRLAG